MMMMMMVMIAMVMLVMMLIMMWVMMIMMMMAIPVMIVAVGILLLGMPPLRRSTWIMFDDQCLPFPWPSQRKKKLQPHFSSFGNHLKDAAEDGQTLTAEYFSNHLRTARHMQ